MEEMEMKAEERGPMFSNRCLIFENGCVYSFLEEDVYVFNVIMDHLILTHVWII